MLKFQTVCQFEETIRAPLNRKLQRTRLNELGLYLKDNTDNEILYTVKEYIERKGIYHLNIKN